MVTLLKQEIAKSFAALLPQTSASAACAPDCSTDYGSYCGYIGNCHRTCCYDGNCNYYCSPWYCYC